MENTKITYYVQAHKDKTIEAKLNNTTTGY